jgi:RimJ/RimL family protein N-acetyltransferase
MPQPSRFKQCSAARTTRPSAPSNQNDEHAGQHPSKAVPSVQLNWCSSSPSTVPPPVARSTRLRTLLRREGLTGILRRFPNRIARDSFGAARATVLESRLAGPLEPVHAEPDLLIRPMDQSDLKRFRQPESLITERRIADFAARLKSGRRASVALCAGQASGYAWFSRQAEIDARCGIEISLGADEGYTYDGFIFPAFRRRGIYAQLLLSCLDWLQKEGCRRAYAIVFSDNTASLNAHCQVGFRPYGQMSYNKIFNFRWRRKYDLCPPGENA